MRHSIGLCTLLSVATLLATPPGLHAQQADASFDGLVPLERSRADEVYYLPEANFSIYDKFLIEEPVVAFRKNWQRDYNRGTTDRVDESDMERMRESMKELFLEVFTQELEKAGYAVVEAPGEDVMTLRPSIIDLDVTAPDIQSASRTRNYVTSAGSARLYIEFYDSLTDQIIARATDYQRARQTSNFQWATAASNRAEARNVLRRWSNMLIERLDEIHGK